MNYFTSVLVLLPMVFSVNAVNLTDAVKVKQAKTLTPTEHIQAARTATHYGPAFLINSQPLH